MHMYVVFFCYLLLLIFIIYSLFNDPPAVFRDNVTGMKLLLFFHSRNRKIINVYNIKKLVLQKTIQEEILLLSDDIEVAMIFSATDTA